VATLILNIYGVALIILLVMMFLPWRLWFVEIAGDLLEWALLPSIPVMIIFILMRARRGIAIWTIPTLAFLYLFGALFLPSWKPAPTPTVSSEALTVMTWNLHGKNGLDRMPQVDVLRNSGADIVALQEITDDAADLIDSRLSDLYPYRILIPGGIAGSGLLSKYPIESREAFLLPPGTLYCIEVLINVNGKSITVMNIHTRPECMLLEPVYTAQGSPQIKNLLNIIPRDGPTLMMGDFNLTDQSSDYRALARSGLRDTFREVGWGFGATWPVHVGRDHRFYPVARLDYVWHSDEFQAQSIRIGARVISDHLPVLADLIFQN
jgi:vancomycin resistance protein VanJ